jgi:hypothetical protein
MTSKNTIQITNDSEAILPNLVIDKNPKDIQNHIKSHDMVFATLDLSPRMCDILAMLFTRMRAEDWFVNRDIDAGIPAQPRYKFTAKEIGSFLLMEPKHVATILKLPSKKLGALTAGFERSDGSFKYSPLFTDIEYSNGLYTIVPNNELRNSYIAKAKANGYALINNSQYLALKHTSAKKMLDLLSRYKTGKSLYPITIERLQQTFGVIGEQGEVKKPYYTTTYRFIQYVIKPALGKIANSEESKDRIRLFKGRDGTLGFDLIDDGECLKVQFLYEWLNCYSDEDIELANIRIETILQENMYLQKEGKRLSLDSLYELKECCKIVSTESEDMRIMLANIIAKTDEAIRVSKMEDLESDLADKSKHKEKHKDRLTALLNGSVTL